MYRQQFIVQVDNDLKVTIRESVNEGMALGNDYLKAEVDALYGRRVKPTKMDRSKKVVPDPIYVLIFKNLSLLSQLKRVLNTLNNKIASAPINIPDCES
jgi:hypothetical protein